MILTGAKGSRKMMSAKREAVLVEKAKALVKQWESIPRMQKEMYEKARVSENAMRKIIRSFVDHSQKLQKLYETMIPAMKTIYVYISVYENRTDKPAAKQPAKKAAKTTRGAGKQMDKWSSAIRLQDRRRRTTGHHSK